MKIKRFQFIFLKYLHLGGGFKINKRLTASLLIIGICLSTFGYWQYLSTQRAKAAWLSEDWQYRKAISITNGSGGNLSDYQVSVALDTATLITAGKMQSDCDDIRIADQTSKVLPYWIETGKNACNTATTAIWTKIPSIPTSGVTIFLYYGNATAGIYQDGNDVFPFFDDFGDGSIDPSKWTQGTLSATSGTSFGETGGNLTGGNSNRYIQSASSFTGNYAVETRIYETTSAANGFSSAGFYGSSTNSYGILVHNGNTYFRNDTTWSSPSAMASSQWTRDVSKVVGTAASASRTSEVSGQITNSVTNSGISTEYVRLGSRYDDGVYDQNFVATWDWLFVRKASATEPSVGSPGTEESGQGPVAYWKFDEGYGSTTQESTMGNNDGTITGAVWQSEDMCVNGKCLYFDGSGDNVQAATEVKLGTKFTFSQWIKTSAAAAQVYTLGNAGGDSGYRFGISVGKVAFLVGNGGGNYSETTCGTKTVNDNQWHQITGIFDSGNKFTCYIDGKYEAEVSIVNFSGMATTAPGIGAPLCCIDFSGYIDETKIYNYARTADQIKTDFSTLTSSSGENAALGRPPNNNKAALSDGLVGYWKMNEASWNGTAGQVADSSGLGNNGTSYGNATTAAGKFGQGATFDGNGDYVSVAHNASIAPGGDYTVSTWFKASNDTAAFFLLKNGEYGFKWNGSAAALQYYDNVYRSSTKTSWNLGQWYYIAMVKSGSSVNFYIDGVLDSTAAGAAHTLVSASLDFGYLSGTYYTGQMDDTRIYNRALSLDDIGALYKWAPGPVGYWKMNEVSWNGTSGEVKDSSSFGNNGTATNGPTTIIGKYGKAGSFAGDDDKLIVGNSASLQITGPITAEAWVKTTMSSVDFQPAIISKGGGSYFLAIGDYSASTPRAAGYIYVNSTWYYLKGNTAINDGAWHHIAMVYDGAYLSVYRDGISDATPVAVTGTIASDTSDLTIGTYYNAGYFNGSIDEAKVYNYARTGSQILEDMGTGMPVTNASVGSSTSGHVGAPAIHWKFDEGGGSTVSNAASSGYAGTAYNAPVWTKSGKFGGALTLDGVTDQVIADSSGGLNFNSSKDVSFSLWVKPDATDDGGNVISKPWNGSGQYNYNLTSGSGADQTFGLSLFAGTGWSTTTASTISAGSWHHIAVTLEGSTKKVKIYVDGKLDRDTAHNIANWTPSAGDANLNLVAGCIYPYGSDYCGGSTIHSYKGGLDEFKWYSGVLSADDVKTDYNHGSALLLGGANTYDEEGFGGAAPVGEWNFEERTGSTTKDTSGNNLTGTITEATWDRGKVGNALRFDGTNDEVHVGDNAALDLSTAGTISVWAKSDIQYPNTDTNDYFRTLVSKSWGGSASTITYNLHWYGDDTTSNLRFCISNGSSADCPLYNLGPITVGQWNNYAVTWNGTNVKWYVNGRWVQTDNSTIAAQNSSTDLYIGGCGFGCGPAMNWDGVLDQVKVYNYARNQAQIAYDYNRGGPIGWWKFNECKGATISDVSGNGNAGTVSAGSGGQTSVGDCDTNANTMWYNGRSGKFGSALSFDGVDDYVGLNYASQYNIREAISLSVWVKRTSAFSQLTDVHLLSRPPAWYFYDSWNSGSIQGDVYIDGVRRGAATAAVPFDSSWYHLVYTYDSSTHYAKMYKNGVLVSSTEVTGLSNYLIDSSTANFSNMGANSLERTMLIDDARIYNYALTASQVSKVMNEGAAVRFGPSLGSP